VPDRDSPATSGPGTLPPTGLSMDFSTSYRAQKVSSAAMDLTHDLIVDISRFYKVK